MTQAELSTACLECADLSQVIAELYLGDLTPAELSTR